MIIRTKRWIATFEGIRDLRSVAAPAAGQLAIPRARDLFDNAKPVLICSATDLRDRASKLEGGGMAKLSVPTINLASIVYGLDDYLRARGCDPAEALRRADSSRLT